MEIRNHYGVDRELPVNSIVKQSSTLHIFIHKLSSVLILSCRIGLDGVEAFHRFIIRREIFCFHGSRKFISVVAEANYLILFLTSSTTTQHHITFILGHSTLSFHPKHYHPLGLSGNYSVLIYRLFHKTNLVHLDSITLAILRCVSLLSSL